MLHHNIKGTLLEVGSSANRFFYDSIATSTASQATNWCARSSARKVRLEDAAGDGSGHHGGAKREMQWNA